MINEKANLASLHDWEIVGVYVNRVTKKVEVVMYYPEKGSQATLEFSGVQKLFLSGLIMQNVILDVLLFDGISDSDYFLRGCELLGSSPSDIENTGKKLIYFEPSVGAELACLFSDFEFIGQD